MRPLLALLLSWLVLLTPPAGARSADEYALEGWLRGALEAFRAAPEPARSAHAAELAEQLARSGELAAALEVAGRLSEAQRAPAWGRLGEALLVAGRFDAARTLSDTLGQLSLGPHVDASAVLRLRYELLVRCGALAEAEALFEARGEALVEAGVQWTDARGRAIAHATTEAGYRSRSIARRVVQSLTAAGCSAAELAPIEIALMLRSLEAGEIEAGAEQLQALEDGRRLQDVGAARRAHELLFEHELESGSLEPALERATRFALQFHDNELLARTIARAQPARAPQLAELALERAQPRDSNGLDRLQLFSAAAFARAWDEPRSEALLSRVVAFDTEATLELLAALCAADREERARELAAGVRDLEIAVDLQSARISLEAGNLDRFERRMDAARARVQRDRLWPRLLLAEALVEFDQRFEARIEIDRLYDALSLDPAPAPEHVRRLVALDMAKRGGFGMQLALDRIHDPALTLRLTLAAVGALRAAPEP